MATNKSPRRAILLRGTCKDLKMLDANDKYRIAPAHGRSTPQTALKNLGPKKQFVSASPSFPLVSGKLTLSRFWLNDSLTESCCRPPGNVTLAGLWPTDSPSESCCKPPGKCSHCQSFGRVATSPNESCCKTLGHAHFVQTLVEADTKCELPQATELPTMQNKLHTTSLVARCTSGRRRTPKSHNTY